MDNNHEKYIFSLTAGEGLSKDDFNIEFYEYNSELKCEGSPKKVIKNFDELIIMLEEWEE